MSALLSHLAYCTRFIVHSIIINGRISFFMVYYYSTIQTYYTICTYLELLDYLAARVCKYTDTFGFLQP